MAQEFNQLGTDDVAALRRQKEAEQGPPEEVDAHGRPVQSDDHDDNDSDYDLEAYEREALVDKALDQQFGFWGTETSDSPKSKEAEMLNIKLARAAASCLAAEKDATELANFVTRGRQVIRDLPDGRERNQMGALIACCSIAHLMKTGNPVAGED
jgi:hypothetical protein